VTTSVSGTTVTINSSASGGGGASILEVQVFS
jgi:hypothetical protein